MLYQTWRALTSNISAFCFHSLCVRLNCIQP